MKSSSSPRTSPSYPAGGGLNSGQTALRLIKTQSSKTGPGEPKVQSPGGTRSWLELWPQMPSARSDLVNRGQPRGAEVPGVYRPVKAFRPCRCPPPPSRAAWRNGGQNPVGSSSSGLPLQPSPTRLRKQEALPPSQAVCSCDLQTRALSRRLYSSNGRKRRPR